MFHFYDDYVDHISTFKQLYSTGMVSSAFAQPILGACFRWTINIIGGMDLFACYVCLISGRTGDTECIQFALNMKRRFVSPRKREVLNAVQLHRFIKHDKTYFDTCPAMTFEEYAHIQPDPTSNQSVVCNLCGDSILKSCITHHITAQRYSPLTYPNFTRWVVRSDVMIICSIQNNLARGCCNCCSCVCKQSCLQ